MMESQGVFERAAEPRLAQQRVRPERSEAHVAHEPLASEQLAAATPERADLLRVYLSLLLLVLGALLVYFSARLQSDPALLAGSVSLLASVVLYRRTRLQLRARIERRALASGIAPEAARAQSLTQADELLAKWGRGDPWEPRLP